MSLTAWSVPSNKMGMALFQTCLTVSNVSGWAMTALGVEEWKMFRMSSAWDMDGIRHADKPKSEKVS